MQVSLKQIIKQTFRSYVWLPAFIIFCFFAILASYWANHQIMQFDETLIESNRKVISQQIFAGDSIALRRQLAAMLTLAKWDYVQVSQINNLVLASWASGKTTDCNTTRLLFDDQNNRLGTLCFSSNIYLKSIAALLPFLLGMLIIYTLYFFSIKKIEQILESLLIRFSQISEAIKTKDEQYFESISTKTLEENIFVETFKNYLKNEKIRKNQEIERERNLIFSDLAKQVAHDIRSPLSAINIVYSSLTGIPPDKKKLLSQAIQRINDIASDLLVKNQSSIDVKSRDFQSSKKELAYMPWILESIVSEKILVLQENSAVSIELDYSAGVNCFALTSVKDLQRILSNILNNSIEALGFNGGKIKISLVGNRNTCEIKILDDGEGIPAEILEKIGKSSVTFGKDGGAGLGLFHAFATTRDLGGAIELNSKISDKRDSSSFTSVSIILPTVEVPIWFDSDFKLVPNSSLVLVDPDERIHEVWHEVVNTFNDKNHDIHLRSFFTLKEFKNWFLSSERCLNEKYLICSQFPDGDMDAMSLVSGLNIAGFTTILVENVYDKNMQNVCLAENLRVIPKFIAKALICRA